MPRATLPLREKLRLMAQIARFGVALWRHDTRYPSPLPKNPKFMTAYDAARLIHDGDVIADSGLGGQMRAAILYWAIRERFEATGHPSGLTVINVGGHGGRGVAPGSLDELGQPGLCTRLITSHFETFHALLAQAEAGRCEMHCLPLGIITELFDALGRGRDSLSSPVGVGTFLDPRVGPGSRLTGSGEEFVQADGARLRYRMPPVDVALFNAPAADRHGNIYATHCAVLGESREMARAARRNGGRVIVNVGRLAAPGDDDIFLPAEEVDAVVYHPDTEQTTLTFHRDPWLEVTTNGKEPIADSLARVRFLNGLAPILRRRSAADEVMMRLAAATLVGVTEPGAAVGIGTGLPEEVPAAVYEGGELDRFAFLVETGTIGGLPGSGAFFGAALRPREIVPSVELFKRCSERLEGACLGALEVDRLGRVNVSRRGAAIRDYVGPGGFMDYATHARAVVFVSNWMRGGEIAADPEGLRITKRGAPKFVERVEEITFDAPRALKDRRRVLYVNHAGVFELTRDGLGLRARMPGIDVRRDIGEFTAGRVLLPSGHVPTVPLSVVRGERGFLGALTSLL